MTMDDITFPNPSATPAPSNQNQTASPNEVLDVLIDIPFQISNSNTNNEHIKCKVKNVSGMGDMKVTFPEQAAEKLPEPNDESDQQIILSTHFNS